ncbi:hypothetical protein PAPYR_12937 [Paratrimastix pyriformis]|uniref:Uncharacterized protein n=1 Tax=Paratrimastix pyriformis TaxID=342808 RepID=A0ABQ8U7P1_9EUKA|nr:hypothetical protein PAPYR_12937 [Paratrimastix pyriformis]
MGYKALAGLSFNEDKAARLAAGGVPPCGDPPMDRHGLRGALGGPAAAAPSVKAVMVEALAAACLLNLRSRHASARVMEGACQAMSFLCLMGRAIRSDAAHRWNLVALGAPGPCTRPSASTGPATGGHPARPGRPGAAARLPGGLRDGGDVTLLFELLRRHHDDPALVRLGLAAPTAHGRPGVQEALAILGAITGTEGEVAKADGAAAVVAAIRQHGPQSAASSSATSPLVVCQHPSRCPSSRPAALAPPNPASVPHPIHPSLSPV